MERDDVYAYLSYFGCQAGASTVKGFWAEMDRLGKDRNPYRPGFLQLVGVAETSAEAFELERDPPSTSTAADGTSTALRAAAGLHERGYVIIGRPDEVAEKLREVEVGPNVGQMMPGPAKIDANGPSRAPLYA